MSIYEWLFGKKNDNIKASCVSADKVKPITYKAAENTYKMGWSIYMKSGDTLTRSYENVEAAQRESVRSSIEKEVRSMEDALHLAIIEKKTFVNLNSNILRVDDVIKICMFDTVVKK